MRRPGLSVSWSGITEPMTAPIPNAPIRSPENVSGRWKERVAYAGVSVATGSIVSETAATMRRSISKRSSRRTSAKFTAPTQNEDRVSRYSSSARAMFWNHVPQFDSRFPAKKTAKFQCLSARSDERRDLEAALHPVRVGR